MEDEEEIRSHASPAGSDSPDPSFSPPAGRITVTVASAGLPTYTSAPPASSSQQEPNALALALPVQVGGGGGGTSSNGRVSGGGREDCWSEVATAVLIDAWGERYLELSRGNLKQKHWKEVAEIVSSRDDYGKSPKTDIQCKNRIDTVKKKYKQEKARMAAGGGSSRWVFFGKLDRLIGFTAKIPTASPSGGSGGGSGGGGSSQKIPMGIPMSSRTNRYKQQGKGTTPPFEKLDRLIGATAARIPTAPLSGGGGGGGGGGSQIVPMGIPMSSRSNLYEQQGRTPQPPLQQGIVKTSNESKRWRFKKRGASDSESESETEMSADSADSLPPPPPPKRVKMEKKKEGGGGGGNKWAELTRAILKFGEAYEQAETAKLRQVVEMEKERMKFLKELELQRMQFFVKTQLEISQLRQHSRGNGGGGRRIGGGGNGNTSNDRSGKNNNSSNNNIAAINNSSDVSN